jgi:hypothetical protein
MLRVAVTDASRRQVASDELLAALNAEAGASL